MSRHQETCDSFALRPSTPSQAATGPWGALAVAPGRWSSHAPSVSCRVRSLPIFPVTAQQSSGAPGSRLLQSSCEPLQAAPRSLG